ncbi:hypothetical protein AAV94_09630 [Lampropedia cohaerens]|uniref:Nudix hydrolase domain-containing protein n=1 Tax=Lampropedia cohaerens TaxID=1610491 RepID=A0A0U1PYM1_9BURK|nr:CoA pyrophosphatase [Lampropedia cohaerens]KKW67610.1 hypothetical protein AAV94_09630 [Lampropedia cohaerens]
MDSQARPTRSRLSLPKGFRPQDVPAIAVDSHLPPLSPAAQSIAALRERFMTNPIWTPEWAHEHDSLTAPSVRAAVLLPVLARSVPTVLLTQRAAHLHHHPGQIAFPGGRVDASDASAVAAALREAQEEVGLPADAVEVLGQLPGHLTGSGYAVTPVVGLVQPGLALKANPDEVAEIFEVPLSFLMNPANHRHHRQDVAGAQHTWLSIPYTPAAGREYFIWGVTAAIVRNLYGFLQAPLRGKEQS